MRPTPGPWAYRRITPHITDSNDRVVAIVAWTPDPESPGVRVQVDEDDANGRLLASAPDLLAACKAISLYPPMSVLDASTAADAAYAREAKSALKAVHDAIRKAEEGAQ